MSRKRKKIATAAAPFRWPKVVLALSIASGALLVLLSLPSGFFRRGPEVPDPDRSSMEPQVAAKLEEAREAVLAAPESSETWGRLGMVLHAHRLDADAVVCYRRAAELSPGEFRWPYLLAHALRNADAPAALAAAEEASRVKPDFAPAYVLRAQLLEGANQNDLALEQYRKAVALEPENAMAEFGLGRLHLARDETEEALRHLLRARDLSPEASAVHGALAQAYRQVGDLEAALRENRIASQVGEVVGIVDPVHYAMRKESVASTALLERAIEAEKASDYARAEALYEELSRLRPDDANVRVRFGDVLSRQSKLQAAKGQYEAALAIDSDLAPAHYGLGNALNFEGDYDGAALHYRAALAVRPDHPQTLLNLAGILAFRGELAEAASLCRRVLESDPKNFGANLQLGQVLSQRKAYREAIPFLEAALQVRPDSGPAHRRLSVALVGLGEYKAALKHLERAQELGETMPPHLVEELRRRAETAGQRAKE